MQMYNIRYSKMIFSSSGVVHFLDWEMATVGVVPLDLALLVGKHLFLKLMSPHHAINIFLWIPLQIKSRQGFNGT